MFYGFLRKKRNSPLKGVTRQKTKFTYVVSTLTLEIAQEVVDVSLEPPKTNPSDTLKAKLIQHTSASQEEHIHQLLTAV